MQLFIHLFLFDFVPPFFKSQMVSVPENNLINFQSYKYEYILVAAS